MVHVLSSLIVVIICNISMYQIIMLFTLKLHIVCMCVQLRLTL